MQINWVAPRRAFVALISCTARSSGSAATRFTTQSAAFTLPVSNSLSDRRSLRDAPQLYLQGNGRNCTGELWNERSHLGSSWRIESLRVNLWFCLSSVYGERSVMITVLSSQMMITDIPLVSHRSCIGGTPLQEIICAAAAILEQRYWEFL